MTSKPHRTKSRTTPPLRTPYDQKSSGEGRVLAIGHRQAVGEEDEVGETATTRRRRTRVDERRSRRGEARDKAREDEEGQDRGRNEGEERRTAATNANDEDDAPSTPPAPSPLPHHLYPTTPNERHDDDDTTKSNKTPARRRADAVHDPGGETDAPGQPPPSVRLEGEKNKASSLYVEVDHVETDDDHAEDDDPATVKTPCGHDGRRRAPSQRAHRAP
jgi:hypothetical protein